MTGRPDIIRGRRAFLSTFGRVVGSVLVASGLPVWMRASDFGQPMLKRTAAAMGTTVTIVAYGESRGQLIEATTEAYEELYRLDRLLSVFRPTSDIARLNTAEVDEPVRIDPSTMAVLEASDRFTALTEGRFDATVGGMLSTLGFHEERLQAKSSISDRHLADAREGIGWHHIRFDNDGSVRRLHPSTQIDLGGIGAGFAVDLMGEVLRRRGIGSALIDHSGDLLAIGAPPDTDGWTVGIPDPVDPECILTRLTLRDQALSTSSNSRTTRIVGGRKVGHILEPKTGENPKEWASVTVLAPTSVEADALSTALFVDTNPSGLWRNGRREALLVRPDGREHSVERIR